MINQPPTLVGKQAVLEGLPGHPAIAALEATNLAAANLGAANNAAANNPAWDPQGFTDARFDFGELTLTIAPAAYSRRLLHCPGRRLQLL